MRYLTDGTGLISDNGPLIENLFAIAFRKRIHNGRLLKYNSTLYFWTYQGKPVGKKIMTSSLTKHALKQSLAPEAKVTAQRIIKDSLDFYYKGTNNASSLNFVTFNNLDILPKNLYEWFKEC